MHNIMIKVNKINVMKKIFMLLMLAGVTLGISAQPEARRQAQQKAQQKSNANNMTTRAQIMFPTTASMDEDVVWRRDIYRELNLNDDANAPLYYPVEPLGNQVNLFTYMFKLILSGRIKAYQYKLDGNESFSDADLVKPKAFLDNYHIYYEKDANGRMRLDNSDIPSREVKSYYVKESSYFDQRTSTFHTQVLALCPIMTREDDFGDGGNKYPLFWVKYSDIAPWLSRLPVMGSNLNNVTNMTADDYFTMNRYEGKIYKTNNLQGRVLASYCKSDSAMSREQKKIEQQLTDFEEVVWGHRTDSTDSVPAVAAKPEKVKRTSARRETSVQAGSSRRRNSETTKEPKQKSENAAPRVSARRQRR